MKRIRRDKNGVIVGECKWETTDGYEEVADDDVDYLAYKIQKDQKNTRSEEIEAEMETAGLKGVTIQEANNKIDQIFSSASTVAQMKDAVILTFKKMLPYILK